jgi:hypothetical protein
MVKAILASASVPILMNPVQIGDAKYHDGGILEPVPVTWAFDNGPFEEIEVYLHYLDEDKVPIVGMQHSNMFTLAANILDMMMRQIRNEDVDLLKSATAKIHYLPYKLSDNPLQFDDLTMGRWWNMGRRWGLKNLNK